MCEELEKIESKLKIQDDINEEVNLLLNKMTDTIEQLSEENSRLIEIVNTFSGTLVEHQRDIESLFENAEQIKTLDDNDKELNKRIKTLEEKKEESENVFFNVYTCTL